MIVDLIDVGQRDNGMIVVLVDVTDDDGKTIRLSHWLPPDTLEWRVAEYDLDPIDDLELILDIVLFEPHIEIPDEERLYRADRETAKAAIRSRVKSERGKSDAAKAARRSVGRPLAAAGATEEECRAKLASMSFLHPQVVEIKREAVLRRCEELDAQRGAAPVDRLAQAMRKQEFNEMADMKSAINAKLAGKEKNDD